MAFCFHWTFKKGELTSFLDYSYFPRNPRAHDMHLSQAKSHGKIHEFLISFKNSFKFKNAFSFLLEITEKYMVCTFWLNNCPPFLMITLFFSLL